MGIRHTPNMRDKYDRKEVEALNAEQWMLDTLKLNPSYVFWGPHEDYMWKKEDAGWEAPILRDSWEPIALDELNEVVNFYFSVNRENKECPTCGGRCYHPDSLWVSESFYEHSNPFIDHSGPLYTQDYRAEFPDEETLAKYGPEFRKFCEEMRDGDGCWHNKITQDETEFLVAKGRLWDFTRVPINDEQKEIVRQKIEAGGNSWLPTENGRMPTAKEVNEAQNQRGLGGHDGINRGYLIEKRIERFGLPLYCPECEGHGYVYTAPAAHLTLTMWLLHPRKGCSRGVEFKNIEQHQLPEILAYLKEASTRNRKRFAKAVRAANKVAKAA